MAMSQTRTVALAVVVFLSASQAVAASGDLRSAAIQRGDLPAGFNGPLQKRYAHYTSFYDANPACYVVALGRLGDDPRDRHWTQALTQLWGTRGTDGQTGTLGLCAYKYSTVSQARTAFAHAAQLFENLPASVPIAYRYRTVHVRTVGDQTAASQTKGFQQLVFRRGSFMIGLHLSFMPHNMRMPFLVQVATAINRRLKV